MYEYTQMCKKLGEPSYVWPIIRVSDYAVINPSSPLTKTQFSCLEFCFVPLNCLWIILSSKQKGRYSAAWNIFISTLYLLRLTNIGWPHWPGRQSECNGPLSGPDTINVPLVLLLFLIWFFWYQKHFPAWIMTLDMSHQRKELGFDMKFLCFVELGSRHRDGFKRVPTSKNHPTLYQHPYTP